MTIFGITGTIGSGKGAVVQRLKDTGFAHYSARDFLYEEVERRGLPRNRDSLNAVGESLRDEHGGSYVIDELFARARRAGADAVIESLRTVAEVDSLKQKGGKLISVDADPALRYDRVVKRASDTDQVSFEKFIADEKRESASADPRHMNILACMERADFAVRNDGTLSELYRQVDAILATVRDA